MLLAEHVSSVKSSAEANANGLDEPVGILTIDALFLGIDGAGGVGTTAVIFALVVALLPVFTTGSSL